MDQRILQHLAVITEEEKRILAGSAGIDRELYMEGEQNRITGEKLLEKGRQIAIRPHTRFVRFPEHTHDYVEIVYMCQGSTRHTVNGTPVCLQEGELLMLGQGARQEIAPAGEKDIAVNFIVQPDFFHGILSFLGREETPLRQFILNCLSGRNETSWLYFQVAEALPVQNLIENLLWTMITDVSNKRGLYQMTMGLLMAELLEYTDTLELPSRDEETLLQVLRYIESHYRDGCLTELATLCHYEPSTLSRLIHAKTGKTYTDLLQERRLSQAAWFLRKTDLPVSEISLLVGYENKSYFHRLFQAFSGRTPRQFRLAEK